MASFDFKVNLDNDDKKNSTPDNDGVISHPEKQQQQQNPSTSASSSFSSNLVPMLVLIMLLVCVSIYAYRVGERVNHLELVMIEQSACRCRTSSTRSTDGTSRTTTKLPTTTATSTTTTTTTSSWWQLKDDDIGPPIDDEDADVGSGNDNYGEYAVEDKDSWNYDWGLTDYYNYDYYVAGTSRRKRRSIDNVADGLMSDDAAVIGTRRGHDRHSHSRHRLRSDGNDNPATEVRDSSNERAPSSSSSSSRRSRRRGRKERRLRSGRVADLVGGMNGANMTFPGLKAVHFYAPYRPNDPYITQSQPPAAFSFWTADNWTLSQKDVFHLGNEGIVNILQSGLYIVYAQVVYHDLTGRWSFGVYVGNNERIKCMNTEQFDVDGHLQRHHPHRRGRNDDDEHSNHGVYQHCYTMAVLRLNKYDAVSLQCLYGSRTVVMQPEFTFWGFVQLSADVNQQTL